jgi:hypothetical protein
MNLKDKKLDTTTTISFGRRAQANKKKLTPSSRDIFIVEFAGKGQFYQFFSGNNGNSTRWCITFINDIQTLTELRMICHKIVYLAKSS